MKLRKQALFRIYVLEFIIVSTLRTQLEMLCKIFDINLINVLKIQFGTEGDILLQVIKSSIYRSLPFLFPVDQLVNINVFKLKYSFVLKLVNMVVKNEYVFCVHINCFRSVDAIGNV